MKTNSTHSPEERDPRTPEQGVRSGPMPIGTPRSRSHRAWQTFAAKTMSRCSLLFFAAVSAFAQGTLQVVVPGELANVEGNSSSADLFTTTSARLQQVYSASEFASLGATTGRIDAVSFRFDGGSTQTFLGFRSLSMFLSTTTRSPDSLSPVYDENGGPDAVFAFGGQIGILATNSSLTPRPFEVRIPLTTPFYYDPARGNLSLGIVTSGGSTSLLLDAQFASGDGVGRVFGDNTLSGTVDTLGFVTRFEITPIPEPVPVSLLVLGALLLCACRDIRRRSPLGSPISH